MNIKNIQESQTYSDTRFTKNIIFQEGKSTAFILNLLPGQVLPPHPHPNAHVYLLVLEGSGLCIIDGEKQEINEKNAIHCQYEQRLSIENNSEHPLSLYVVLAKD